MKSYSVCIATCLVGLVLALGAAIALATTTHARGGHAVAPVPARTTKAPPLPKQERGSRTFTADHSWRGGKSVVVVVPN